MNLDDGQLTLNVAMVTILATGGAGQVYARTTNPTVATGDGIAMAYRAGAAIRDLEFVQFHPTGLAVEGQETVLLVTEALRGEGAYLRNMAGERFMEKLRPAGRAGGARRGRARHGRPRCGARGPTTSTSTRRTSTPSMLAERFPTRDRRASPSTGSTWPPTSSPWPPSCHYFIGGVVTDVWGRTTVPGSLRERRGRRARACTAPTGWPRTRCSRASCSRTAWCATSTATSAGSARTCAGCASPCPRAGRTARRQSTRPRRAAGSPRSCCASVGVLRDETGLRAAIAELRALTSELDLRRSRAPPSTRLLNLLTLGDADRQVGAAARGVARRPPARGLPRARRRALAAPHHAAPAGRAPRSDRA